LGNSFVLGAQDPNGLFYQPGTLSRVQGFSGSLQRYGRASTSVSLSAGGSWLSGGVALGIQHLTFEAFGPGSLPGGWKEGLPADLGSLRTQGSSGFTELVISAGYGRTVLGIQAGIVGKLVEERVGAFGAAAVGAVDLGISASQGPVTVGLALQNLGPSIRMEGESMDLPRRASLGASTETVWVGPLDLSASGGLSYQWEGHEVVPSLGIEVSYWPVTGRTFVGRIGVRRLPEPQSGSPFTFGLGFRGDAIILDYAFEGFERGSPTHRLGVGLR